MTEKAYNDAIGRIAEHYGAGAQSMQTCEECAELIQAVSKLTRGVTEMRISALVEEIADVRIMLEQMTFFYGISRRRVTMDIKRKVQRQLERIKAESKCEYVV